jgi:hypothetical protein
LKSAFTLCWDDWIVLHTFIRMIFVGSRSCFDIFLMTLWNKVGPKATKAA